MANEQEAVERIYREEWGRIVATLIRMLGSFDLAEESAQEAFAAALDQWALQGIPANPRAWLIATARHKAIDALRRKTRWEHDGDPEPMLAELADESALDSFQDGSQEGGAAVQDDRLRLIFTCCHPALNLDAQVALTLRTLCGLTTEQIARAFLIPLVTMAQRLVRAKQKIRDAGIPYRTPAHGDLAERLDAVLLVVYLVFNEGYNAAGEGCALSEEAVRLGRVLLNLMPDQPEVRGLLALMLLHESRRPARSNRDGQLILLEDQDRSQWDRALIDEGLRLAESALRAGGAAYSVQAAIAAVHAHAITAEETDWPQIVALYDVLLHMQPSPVIELNRAVAVAMAYGCPVGLRLLDDLEERSELNEYYLLPAARADLLRRIGEWDASAAAYREALALVRHDAERRFLAGRLAEVEAKSGPAIRA